MTDPSSVEIIVVGLDFSAIGDRALDEALRWLAERPGAIAHVVHVAAAYGPMLRLDLPEDVKTVSQTELETFLSEHVRSRVEAFVAGGAKLSQDCVRTHVRVGVPSDEVVALASEHRARFVVVGTHGRRGVTRLLLGSVAEAIVRKASCAVLIVRPKDYPAAEASA